MKYWQKILLVFVVTLVMFISVNAKTADEWIDQVDRHMVLKSAQYTATMTTHLPSGQERVFKMECKVVGEEYALIEYSEPKRELGTRYLKRDDALWIYFPRVDRTMQIQGHMMRQGVQGGDMSFEDMTESSSWKEKYNAEIVEETDEIIVINMVAKDMTVSYPYRKITIDKKNELPVHVLNSDASNYPIKENRILEYKKIDDRYFPTLTEIRSSITENKWTRFEMSNIQFDVDFDPTIFTKRSLEK